MEKLRKFLANSFFPGRNYGTITELDGVRGIAILIVFFGHILLFEPQIPQFIGSFGQVGVYLFFVLSAYLLTDLMIKERKSRSWKVTVQTFIVRRALRIFPMYYFSLLLLNVFPKFANMMFGGREFSNLRHFFLIYPEGNYWAISVELEFYLLVPLFTALVLSAKRFSRIFTSITLFLVAMFFARLISYLILFPPNFPHVLPYVNVFAFGTFAACVKCYFNDYLKKVPQKIIFLLSIVLVTIFVLLVPGIGMEKFGLTWIFTANYSTYAGFASCLFLLTAIYGNNVITKMLSSKVLGLIGTISFSIYMLHVFVMSFLAGSLYVKYGIVATSVIVFALTVALSTVTYLLVERPFIFLGTRISKFLYSRE